MNLKRIRLDERSLPLKVTYRMINNRVEYNMYIEIYYIHIYYTWVFYTICINTLYKSQTGLKYYIHVYNAYIHITLLCPRDSPGKNTGVDCHALLQRDLPTQGLNLSFLCLLHWQAGSLPTSHWGSLILPFASTWIDYEHIMLRQVREACAVWYHT